MRAKLTVLTVAVALTLSCDGGSQAGELAIDLVSPDVDDRAISLEVRAQDPYTIQGLSAACAGCQAFVYQEDETGLRAILIGTFGVGPVARVSVSNVNSPSGYTLTLLDAAGADFELRPLEDRSLSFSR
jgi:hypothetical protein